MTPQQITEARSTGRTQMTTALKQALESLREANDHWCCTDGQQDRLTAAITAAESELSREQPAPNVPELHFGNMDPMLDCDIQPRRLNYSLRDYHHAGYEGPLNATWRDKPHRLLYDLIAAVRFYSSRQSAELSQPARVGLTVPKLLKLWGGKSDGPSNAEIVSFARAVERAHNIPAAQEGK